ncbi:hypothetical protein AAFF_G00415650 [Aldrovandia affinis]|uniref:Uncharacterized protein n=1 Tax=Aldrovandia affinis TaxID=143900 RepID=A0AAD7SD66_9TELE|nr:hypothetical protein AAFF_G00415650 [Aldrovandia affinis]
MSASDEGEVCNDAVPPCGASPSMASLSPIVSSDEPWHKPRGAAAGIVASETRGLTPCGLRIHPAAGSSPPMLALLFPAGMAGLAPVSATREDRAPSSGAGS